MSLGPELKCAESIASVACLVVICLVLLVVVLGFGQLAFLLNFSLANLLIEFLLISLFVDAAAALEWQLAASLSASSPASLLSTDLVA